MDQYDEQIEKLRIQPELILTDWDKAEGLFKMVGKPKDHTYEYDYGCLTMIRNHWDTRLTHPVVAFTNGKPNLELTEEIAKDERIPLRPTDIRIEHLSTFAEWQRKIDALQTDTPEQ